MPAKRGQGTNLALSGDGRAASVQSRACDLSIKLMAWLKNNSDNLRNEWPLRAIPQHIGVRRALAMEGMWAERPFLFIPERASGSLL